MNVGGILKSGVTKLATGTKTVAKSLASKATKTASKPEMLTKASEALSAQGKAGINIGKIIKTQDVAKSGEKIVTNLSEQFLMDDLVRETIKDTTYSYNPKEAVNAAKEVLAATGKRSGKFAETSAKIFEEAGLTQAEKKIAMAEKKTQLMEKYGEKLKHTQASKAARQAAEARIQMLQEARKLY